MLYLLDANVLITANANYYDIERVPQFWEWLLQKAMEGSVKMPAEIAEEILRAKGPVKDWLASSDVKDALILNESADPNTVNNVLENGYAPDLTDTELETIGRDPFLIAYAYGHDNRTVVTKEVSEPKKQRKNRKIPDVCNDFGVLWCDDFSFYRELDFRIT